MRVRSSLKRRSLFPHAVECLNQCAHFPRAARRNDGSIGGAAEMLHGRCKFGHRSDQPPSCQKGEHNPEQDGDDQPCCEQHARKFDRNRVDSWWRIKTAFDQQPMAILECYLNPQTSVSAYAIWTGTVFDRAVSVGNNDGMRNRQYGFDAAPQQRCLGFRLIYEISRWARPSVGYEARDVGLPR